MATLSEDCFDRKARDAKMPAPSLCLADDPYPDEPRRLG